MYSAGITQVVGSVPKTVEFCKCIQLI